MLRLRALHCRLTLTLTLTQKQVRLAVPYRIAFVSVLIGKADLPAGAQLLTTYGCKLDARPVLRRSSNSTGHLPEIRRRVSWLSATWHTRLHALPNVRSVQRARHYMLLHTPGRINAGYAPPFELNTTSHEVPQV